MPQRRIVFMGTPALSAAILESLLAAGRHVAGVVTQPDRPRGRGRKVSPSPVKETAEANGIPVLQPETLRDHGFMEAFLRLEPQVVVTAAFGKILTTEVLSVPPLGCYNVHFSLLPAYRGPAPVQRAVLAGEDQTGITIFRMEPGTDTGPVLVAAPLNIDPEDTAGTLTERLVALARKTLPEVVEAIFSGQVTLTPQDPAKATYAPKLRKSEGRIDWTVDAGEIRNRIRGLSPWPGAFTFWNGKRLRIWAATAERGDSDAVPGQVLDVTGGVIRIAAARGVLAVSELQIEGKKRTGVADFLRGHPLEVGERLDDAP